MSIEPRNWPRFKDGQLVKFGDEVASLRGPAIAHSIGVWPDGSWEIRAESCYIIDQGYNGDVAHRPSDPEAKEFMEWGEVWD